MDFYEVLRGSKGSDPIESLTAAPGRYLTDLNSIAYFLDNLLA